MVNSLSAQQVRKATGRFVVVVWFLGLAIVTMVILWHDLHPSFEMSTGCQGTCVTVACYDGMIIEGVDHPDIDCAPHGGCKDLVSEATGQRTPWRK